MAAASRLLRLEKRRQDQQQKDLDKQKRLLEAALAKVAQRRDEQA